MASAGPYASLHLASHRYHASTPPLSFLQAGCPSCCPTNSVKALKAQALKALFHVDDIYSNCKLHNRAAVFVLLSNFYVLYGEVVDVTLLMRTFMSSLVRD